jgi:hypothetical protein
MLSATQPARFFWAVVMVVLAVARATGDGPIEETLKSVVLIRTPGGLGSGFIVKERSLVATNYHVIEGETEATAEFLDGTSIPISGFVTVSPRHDLAVLRLAEDGPAAPLEFLVGKAELGADVFALGSPKGLAGSVSKGAVSSYRMWGDVVGRLPNEVGHLDYDPDATWVQTDAAVNRGNSGGPLVTLDGRVVAVNTLASSVHAGQNMNFSVAIGHLEVMLDHLLPIPLQMSLLPKQKNARPAGGAEAVGQRTKEFWNSMAHILGTMSTEHRKVAIRLGDFVPPPSNDPADQKRSEPSLRAKGLARSEADRREMARLAGGSHNINSENRWRYRMMLDQQRYAAEQATRGRAYLDVDCKAPATAARELDQLPANGVDEAAVEFCTRLATTLRRWSSAAEAAMDAAGRSSSSRLRQSAELEHLKSVQEDAIHLRDILGPEIKVRLERSYGIELGPVMQFTPEQEQLFEGTWRKSPSVALPAN